MSDALRPKTWDDYIGQEALKRRLRLRSEAARKSFRLLDHMLLIGPPGVGKTSLSALIAQELRVPFESYVMPLPPNRVREVVLNTGGVLLLDEIHRLPAKAQEELLPVVEDGYFQVSWGKEYLEEPLMIIGATTEMKGVIKPLRDRFVIPPFEEYTEEEMGQIVRRMGMQLGIEFTNEAALGLGRAAVGTPRLAKHLVKAANDLPDPNNVEDVLDLVGVTPQGLTVHHIKYLEVLRKSSGTAGVKVLAGTIGIPEPELLELEFVLRKLDMIENTPRGRSLKSTGYKFLKNNLEVTL